MIILGCGLGALTFLALAVATFYGEEDLRGAAAWDQAREQIEAQGISLKRDDYIPRMPAPEQNFGALPFFAIVPDRKSEWAQGMTDAALEKALEPLVSRMPYSKNDKQDVADSLPFLEKWSEGTKPDLQALHARLVDMVGKINPGTTPPTNADSLTLFSEICPALAELRDANASRPLCVFPRNYNVQPPTEFSFEPDTELLLLLRVLTYEERLALYSGQPQLALDDLAVGRKIVLGLQKDPFVVSGLIACAFAQNQNLVIQQGLADHLWTDAQLRQLEMDVGSFDALASGRFWFKGEIVAYNIPVSLYYASHRWVSDDVFRNFQDKMFDLDYHPPLLAKVSFYLTPRGWLDLDRAAYDQYHLLGTAALIDPAKHRVYADRKKSLEETVKGKKSWTFWSEPLIEDNSITNSITCFAFVQAGIDQARIACRLERCRLAHGVYPAALDALAPDYGAALPQDIMNGEPYHYRLREDGSYLLYSVAWNQEDDHGEHATTRDQKPMDALDWVWPSRYEKADE
jgi:hypothetical protein